MDPDDLLKINLESERENRPIKAFYHSHPDHPSYFSEKDKSDALFWGEPATQIVPISFCPSTTMEYRM